MIDAIFDGDYKEVFDDTKSIIFYANDVIFPKMPNNVIAKSNLSSFTKSELYVRLMEEQKEKKPLKSIRQIVVDLVDTQVDNYSFPVFIFDNHGTLYFINNRAVQLYFDKEDYYSDEETKRQRLEKSLKDRDDIIVVFWNVYEEI